MIIWEFSSFSLLYYCEDDEFENYHQNDDDNHENYDHNDDNNYENYDHNDDDNYENYRHLIVGRGNMPSPQSGASTNRSLNVS